MRLVPGHLASIHNCPCHQTRRMTRYYQNTCICVNIFVGDRNLKKMNGKSMTIVLLWKKANCSGLFFFLLILEFDLAIMGNEDTFPE